MSVVQATAGSLNMTVMNIQLGTVAASVYYNCQGYQSF
jgi:hypothetical protein